MDPIKDFKTGKAGVIMALDDASGVEKLKHAVLDDVLYNVVHQLVMKVHRDEKQARATTAATRVEKLASDASETSTPDSRPDVRIETDAAIYEDGKVMLKGNPLKTTKEILCPRCKLPRLLYPTDGKGARKPDPSVIYCKRHPYIEKPGHDIYGQTWVAPGPGRGKKKKDVEKAKQAAAVAAGENVDSPGKSPVPEQRPANVLSYPSATCVKCKRCILVTRLNNHMGSCIGNSGRNASRAAAAKISNGANGNHSHDRTPPSSQKGTPAPGSRAASPKKREASVMEDDDDGSEASNPKKKKLKATTKKVILKAKPMGGSPLSGMKKEKVKASSGLSMEQKPDDDEKSVPHQTEILPPKPKKPKAPSPAKKIKLGQPTSTTKIVPPPMSSPATTRRDGDAESESSGTLSSPPN
ncbi:putative transcriptional activator protein [Zalerion maritima]|uniref:Transcriptional activator protein n=1 Tax=Zalerion maritima TaxID=339359 RepID=A0AAD5WS16_9PEZI|nr:putative transcriptional activator protein [Zalerion maritima]